MEVIYKMTDGIANFTLTSYQSLVM